MPPTEAPIESVDDAVRQYYWVEHRTRTILLSYTSTLLMLMMFVYIVLCFFEPELVPGIALAPIPVLTVVTIQFSKFLMVYNIRARFFKGMAESFGLSFSDSALMSTVSGHLFGFGHSRRLAWVFAGTHSGHDVRFYTYVFTTGGGKSKTTHYLRVFEAECHTELPEIMLHPLSVTPGGMSWQPRGTRPLTLEGLFNKQFEVYVPVGMEIEALQVLEPQHMDMLMQQYGDMGFYTHKTKLYAFTDAPLPTTRTDFTNLIALVDTLYDTLVPELHGVSGDVTALREAFAKGK